MPEWMPQRMARWMPLVLLGCSAGDAAHHSYSIAHSPEKVALAAQGHDTTGRPHAATTTSRGTSRCGRHGQVRRKVRRQSVGESTLPFNGTAA